MSAVQGRTVKRELDEVRGGVVLERDDRNSLPVRHDGELQNGAIQERAVREVEPEGVVHEVGSSRRAEPLVSGADHGGSDTGWVHAGGHRRAKTNDFDHCQPCTIRWCCQALGARAKGVDRETRKLLAAFVSPPSSAASTQPSPTLLRPPRTGGGNVAHAHPTAMQGPHVLASTQNNGHVHSCGRGSLHTTVG